LLRIRCTRGNVFLGGHIQRITYDHADLDEKKLRQIDLDLHRVKNVRNIVYQFENWERLTTGGWRWTDRSRRVSIEGVGASDETVIPASTINISEEEEPDIPDSPENPDEEISSS